MPLKIKQKKSVSFKKYCNLVNRVIECSKRLYYTQVVKTKKENIKKLWKIVNNIVFTKSFSSFRIKGVLDEYGKIVNDLKCVSNLMNKNFVNIADKLLKERKDVIDLMNDAYCSGSVKNDFVFNEISDSEIQNYTKTMNLDKSVRSDVPSICFVKLSAKIISPYLSKLYNKCV